MSLREECGVFSSHKDMGLVSEVFSSDILSSLPQGTMEIIDGAYSLVLMSPQKLICARNPGIQQKWHCFPQGALWKKEEKTVHI